MTWLSTVLTFILRIWSKPWQTWAIVSVETWTLYTQTKVSVTAQATLPVLPPGYSVLVYCWFFMSLTCVILHCCVSQTYSIVLTFHSYPVHSGSWIRISISGIVGVKEGQKCMNRPKSWMFKLSLNLFNVTQCVRVCLPS